MKTFALRTVFEAKNLSFSTEGALCPGPDAAHFIKERKLPYSSHETIGVAPDGKQQVKVSCREREFRGQPLLLEIVTSCDVQDTASPLDVRTQLEGRTAHLAALLTWSLPGVVGRRLADALFVHAPDDPENVWAWLEVERINVMECFPQPQMLAARFSTTEQVLNGLNPLHRDIAITALRWWRQGREAALPADRLVAYWIVLESIASFLGSDRYIGRRVEEMVQKVFPSMSAGGVRRRTTKLVSFLYKARCSVVHEGVRDLLHSPALVAVAEDTATAAIRFLLEGQSSANPPADLLTTLGI